MMKLFFVVFIISIITASVVQTSLSHILDEPHTFEVKSLRKFYQGRLKVFI